MSARLSILMVKNSRSFELTKIRHYADNPYRTFYERAKAAPPILPTLHDWQDESLGGAINPAPDQPKETGEIAAAPAAIETPTMRKAPARRPAKKKVENSKPSKLPSTSDIPLKLIARSEPQKPVRKALSLGEAPPAPGGESCDVREMLASVATNQDEAFGAMIGVLGTVPESARVRQASEMLVSLHQSFGDDEK
jgi:type IV secretion system protein VirD4